MISQDLFKKLSLTYQSTELNVRREYVQHLFLSYFYQQPQTDQIYFKGGTALRIVYNSPRFSEDLDFSSSLTDRKLIEDIILNTIKEIGREGITIDIRESKETSGGYLAIIGFNLWDQELAVQLEISYRKSEKKGEVTTIARDFLPAYTLITLVREHLIEEKIQALLSRKKPRDFYDFYFILRANLLSPKGKKIVPQVLATLQKVDINFEQELKQFLPKSHWAIIKDFKTILEREISRFI